MKEVYDVKGKQSSIFRLAPFDTEALIHMLAYRILIFVSIAAGIAILVNLAFNGLNPINIITKLLVFASWLLLTPQLFEFIKGFMAIGSNGLVFGHLNESYTNSLNNKKNYEVLKIVPYTVLVVWVLGFILLVFEWL